MRTSVQIGRAAWLMERVSCSADGCWLWTATLNRDGYPWNYHRISYETFVGPIPKGLDLDHLCRVKHCINPAHLEPVTGAENERRKEEALGIGRYATHCKWGHEFTPENTYFGPAWNQQRCCRACGTANARRRRARLRSAGLDGAL